jgi:hypothetical protein
MILNGAARIPLGTLLGIQRKVISSSGHSDVPLY